MQEKIWGKQRDVFRYGNLTKSFRRHGEMDVAFSSLCWNYFP
jgi:hypothetical protein